MRTIRVAASTMAVIGLLATVPPDARAAEAGAGTALQAFSLPDQHDKPQVVDAQTRLLLFSRDKGLAKMAFEVLGAKDGAYLDQRHARFILDISAMPRVISWAIAKPRMRRHAFTLLLDNGPGATKDFPSKEGSLTLLYLNGLKVEAIKYVSDPKALEAELAGLKP